MFWMFQIALLFGNSDICGAATDSTYVGCHLFDPLFYQGLYSQGSQNEFIYKDFKIEDWVFDRLTVPNYLYPIDTITKNICLYYCQYQSTVQPKFDYVATVGKSDCFCLYDLSDCKGLLAEYICDNLTIITAARVYSICPPGFFNPPACSSPCKSYCNKATSGYANGKTLCRHNGDCTHGCVNNICENLWGPCQNLVSHTRPDLPFPQTPYRMQGKHKAGLTIYRSTALRDLNYYTEQLYVLTNVNAWTTSLGESFISMWCPTGEDQFALVGKYPITCMYCNEDRYNSFVLKPQDYIWAEKLCVFGIHQAVVNNDATLFRSSTDPNVGAAPHYYDPNTFDASIPIGKVVHIPQPSDGDLIYAASVYLTFNCLCSQHCIAGVCNSSGLCTLGCEPGYYGYNCKNLCPPYTFGTLCTQSCSELCVDQECDPILGQCTRGCTNIGFFSPYCNVSCDGSGYYGWNCASRCSANCLHGLKCNYSTGTCPSGCAPGYQPPQCLLLCENGYFGQDCQYQCGDCSDRQPCDKVTGACPYGCQSPLLASESCGCPKGLWKGKGQYCNMTCGRCAVGASCHDILGTCSSGCLPGYSPPLCLCLNGYYSYQCNQNCGNCLDVEDIGCETEHGYCLQGCAPGYLGIYCDAKCPPGFFGLNCTQSCGNCYGNNTCAYDTGECDSCVTHYKPPFCRCVIGTYGPLCQFECGACAQFTHCSDTDGFCPDGCRDNTEPPLCLCPFGQYGSRCASYCGQCANNETCHPVTGECASCAPGYIGIRCTEPCPPGYYGEGCRQQCGGCLQGDSSCSHTDGFCMLGCQAYLQPPLCLNPCHPGTYGVDCSQKCGNCYNNQPCDAIDGSCSQGCQDSTFPPLCISICDAGLFGPNCNQTCGACVNGTTCESQTGSCPYCSEPGIKPPLCLGKCHPGTYGPNCTLRCGMCRTNTYCNEVTGRCPDGCMPPFKPPYCQECAKGHCGFLCLGQCGQCVGGSVCDSVTCICLGGCDDGSINSMCGATYPDDKTNTDFLNQLAYISQRQSRLDGCPPGLYGVNCTYKCGNCSEGKPCDGKTGNCPGACELGFVAPLCQDCSSDWYGFQCSMQCGFCVNGEVCRTSDGACVDGCADGYMLPECKQKCQAGFYGHNCNFECGECLNMNDCNFIDGHCETGCVLGYVGDNCDIYLGATGVKLMKLIAAYGHKCGADMGLLTVTTMWLITGIL